MLRLGSPTRNIRHSSPASARAAVVALASGAVLVAGAFVAPPAAQAELPTARSGADPVLSTVDVGGGLRTAETPLPAAARGGAGSVIEADRFTMVALTWRAGGAEGEAGHDEPVVRVRVRRDGDWQDWQRLSVLHDGPTPGSPEARSGREGTDLAWTGPADALRVSVSGAQPLDLRLVLSDSTGVRADRPVQDAGALSAARRGQRAKGLAPRPLLRSRASWGAVEKWRSPRPKRNRTIRQVHLHHTAGSNSYRRADVPGIIAGTYRYHAKTLGWSDIGYNVLVDKFGRAWVGRHGGVGRRVRGAHTLGFNHNSTGIAVIGNFEKRAPSKKVIRKVARIVAWQMDRNGRDARGRIKVTSRGSDRFPARTRVRLPLVDAHSHTNQTACPGEQLRAVLPKIRRKAQRRIDRH